MRDRRSERQPGITARARDGRLPHRLSGRLTAGLIAAVAVAVVLAACGGHSATRKDVIARANAVCSGALASIRAVTPPTATSTAALGAYLHKVSPIVDKETQQLVALPRPAERKLTLDAFVSAFQTGDHAYDAAAKAASRGDTDGLAQALATLRSSRAPTLAREYGLTACTGTSATVR